MSDLKSAAKLALDALELVNLEFVCGNGSHHKKEDRHEWDEDCPITDRWRKAIAALKEALAQPEQEPVATVTSETGVNITMSWWHEPPLPIGTKLYTHPPQNVIDKSAAIRIATTLGWTPPRTWVGLTYEDMVNLQKDLHDDKGEIVLPTTFARAIEAKLKEKNT